MSKVFFNAINNTVETMTARTSSSSAVTFDSTIVYQSGSGRVSWDLGDGNGLQATNNLSYTFSDSGDTKVVTLKTNNLANIKSFAMINDDLVGNLDMTGFDNLGGSGGYMMHYANASLTSVTHSYSPGLIGSSSLGYVLSDCNIIGNHDMSMFPNLIGSFRMNGNPNLTGITHTASTQSIINYIVYSCDITGNHDMSMFPNLGGALNINSNPNLTGITHTASTQTFTNYLVSGCDITGNHDVSMFPNLGGIFIINSNPNLTGITHTASTQTFTNYLVDNCNLTGTHTISMLSGLTGFLKFNGNEELTNIIFPSVTQDSGNYVNIQDTNITGAFDMTSFSGLGEFTMYNVTGVTSIAHAVSSNAGGYSLYNCEGLSGIHDVSMLTGKDKYFRLYENNALEGVIFPVSTETFYDTFTSNTTKAFVLQECDYGYINFHPLSGATMDTGTTYGATILMQDNNMLVSEVNQVLGDLDSIATAVPSKWAGVTLDISGTNAAPDGSSGGFDGAGATLSLIANGWTVTTS